MNGVGELERITQNRIIELFQDVLQYEYLGNWENGRENSNIEEELLRQNLLVRGYDDSLITKAIHELQKEATNQSRSLYENNKQVYSLLRYPVKVRPEAGENTQDVWLIDWSNPDANHFALAEEVTVRGEHDKRPDIVLYINGIAVGVLELKRSFVSLKEGIRQNLDNQQPHFIQPFFSTMQLIMAGNDIEGMQYGVIETPEKYYLTWKEEKEEDKKVDYDLDKEVRRLSVQREHLLDKQLIQMCHKERLLELLHDFIVFDRGVKKLCRPNQYFGVKAAQQHVKDHQGGILWHTQGSGKSLIMVWLAKWIREYDSSARVLIITDRDELDKQIEKVFKGIDEDIYRTKSSRDFLKQLNNTNPWLLCSLIHKFGVTDETDYEGYIQDIRKNLQQHFANFKAKGNMYVFVDEAHRTQSGKLHRAMKEILPESSLFIGFTGTPLLKQDKQTSLEVFGPYIHTYKFDKAVEDGVILDLKYEARDIDQKITSQDKIDQWFDAKTKGLTDFAKTQLKQKWGTMQQVLSSESRLQKIVSDIMLDMETKDRLQSGNGNAMLVAGSIYQACKYYELFQKAGLKKCAIITSYDPNVASIKGESVSMDEQTEQLQQYAIYQQMLDGKDPEEFEDEVKKTFIEEPGQMKLLIVVDKLLTGFDAPSATYLYIDKTMQDHGLFQAICRVNRLDGEDKEYGFVIDYKDLFKSLEKAVDDYTSEAFEDFDKADVEGLLQSRLIAGKERLEEALEKVVALCEPVPEPRTTMEYIEYFCGDTSKPEELRSTQSARLELYKSVASLVRAYASIANEMLEVGFSREEIESIKSDVKYYENVRSEVKLASGDYIDLKAYEPAMRHLIDNYINAGESEVISKFDDLSLIELLIERGEEAIQDLPEGIKSRKEAVAETIENNVRKLIVDEAPTNPKYYENMSTLLDEIIAERKRKSLEYRDYLRKIIELTKKAKDPTKGGKYPNAVNTAAKRALYDNFGEDESLVLQIDEAVLRSRQDLWRGNLARERIIMGALYDVLQDHDQVKEVFELVKQQSEY